MVFCCLQFVNVIEARTDKALTYNRALPSTEFEVPDYVRPVKVPDQYENAPVEYPPYWTTTTEYPWYPTYPCPSYGPQSLSNIVEVRHPYDCNPYPGYPIDNDPVLPIISIEETNGQICYEMESPKTCYQKDSQGYEVFYYTSKSVPREHCQKCCYTDGNGEESCHYTPEWNN